MLRLYGSDVNETHTTGKRTPHVKMAHEKALTAKYTAKRLNSYSNGSYS